MLTNEQNYILYLLRKSLGLQVESVEAPLDEELVTRYILKSGILLTVYSSLSKSEQQRLKEPYLAAVRQYIAQAYEGEKVLHALSVEELNCIPLKGWELRKFYPHDGMRQMADLDILVKPYAYDKIKVLMSGLGYACGTESSWKHDNFKKNDVNVEMHKRLTDDSGVIQTWEEGLWARAVPVEGSLCRMAPEDFYIFHFVHLHKDFLNGSLGLRRIADTWLLHRQEIANMTAVRETLENFGMWVFHERMVKLASAAMEETPIDENDELLLRHAFTNGIYGSGKSYKAGRIAAMGDSVRMGKLQSAVAAVFLPYGRMKAQFPPLKKYPLLLPYFWVKRIIGFLKENLKESWAKLDYRDIGEEEYKEMKRFFKAGGIGKG